MIHEWPEVGLIAMDSPLDPEPSQQLASGQVVEMDRSAARYAAGRPATPVPVKIDNMMRLRLIMHTTLMHLRKTREIRPGVAPAEMKVGDG